MSAAVGHSGAISTGLPNMGDISQLIRLKERELHEIHDLRTGQLEKVIEERDAALHSLQGRFEHLKDDFSYNLTLLGARDEEISRLEQAVEERDAELAEAVQEKRSMSSRLDVLELREIQRTEQRDAERANNKRILNELKEVIESLRWAALEDTKAKQRDIDVLKEDNRTLAMSRDEALEAQRRDLTSTFEALLMSREQSQKDRDREVGAQVAALESKFEQIGTENSRLKHQLRELQRRLEISTEESNAREERLQQLQWLVDDERARSSQSTDSLARQLNAAQLALSAAKESAMHEAHELRAQLERHTAEIAQGQDYRLLLERRLEERGTGASTAARNSEIELAGLLRARTDAVAETARYRAIAQEAQDAARRVQKELEAGQRLLSTAQEECDRLHVALRQAQEASVAAAAENAAHQLKLAKEHAVQVLEAQNETAERAAAVQDLERRLQTAVGALREEQVESAALRLRLRLADGSSNDNSGGGEADSATRPRDKEHHANQERLTEARVRSLQLELRGSVPPAYTSAERGARSGPGNVFKSAAGRGKVHPDDDHLLQSSTDAPSPLFSEDFGDVSLPASPEGRMNSFFMRASLDRDTPAAASAHLNPASAKAEADRLGDANSGALLSENERLRGVVQRMRAEMEALQQQALNVSAEREKDTEARIGSDTGKEKEKEQERAALEHRLERSTAEVVRLRAERRAMMDTANALRAALLRAGGALPLPLPLPPPAAPAPAPPAQATMQGPPERREQHQQQQQQQQQQQRAEEEAVEEYPPRGRKAPSSRPGAAAGAAATTVSNADTFSMVNGMASALGNFGGEPELSTQTQGLGVVGSAMGSRRSAASSAAGGSNRIRPSGAGGAGAAAGTGTGTGAGAGAAGAPSGPAARKVLNYAIGLREVEEKKEKAIILERPSKNDHGNSAVDNGRR